MSTQMQIAEKAVRVALGEDEAKPSSASEEDAEEDGDGEEQLRTMVEWDPDVTLK